MKSKAFPTDLTDAQWGAVERLIPLPIAGGRKRETNLREVVNAIRYLLATQCGWRNLPARFPNRSTVRHYYDAWHKMGLWQLIETVVNDRISPTLLPDSSNTGEIPQSENQTS